MRKSAAVPLVITSSLALALAGCAGSSADGSSGTGDGQDAEYQGVCVDQASGQRADDDDCGDDDGHGGTGGSAGGHYWYYGGRGARVPAIGTPMPVGGGSGGGSGGQNGQYAGFDRSVPEGSTYVSGGADRAGGTVSSESLSTASSSTSGRVLSATESGSTVRGGLGGGSKAGS